MPGLRPAGTAAKQRRGAGSSPDCGARAAILASRYVLPSQASPATGGRSGPPGGPPARPAHPRLRGRRLPVLPGRARLRSGLLRRPRRAPGHRPGDPVVAGDRAGGGRSPAAAVRGPAHRDGPALVQAPLEPAGPGPGRAGHVRPGRDRGSGPAAVVLAAGGWHALAPVRPGGGRRPDRLRGGLAGRHQLHVRHQPLRSVRAAPGLAACARGRATSRRPSPNEACTAASATRSWPGSWSCSGPRPR